MKTKDEALKMAIEAFEPEESTWWSHTKMSKAYKACKEALEQPAQEPNTLEMAGFELDGVIADIKMGDEFDRVCFDTIVRVRKTISDYVAQPAQEPFGYFTALPFGWTDCGKDDEGAIALYEHPAPQQEPVAIVESHYGFTDAIVTFLTENNEQLPIGTLLYAEKEKNHART